MNTKRYLITGGCGFLGSNLARHLLTSQVHVIIVDNLFRHGSACNLEWLKTQGNFDFYHADIRCRNDIERIIQDTQPEIIFHLAGQVAMTTSLTNPLLDFETNLMGSIYLLEAVRKYCKDAVILYSSTNKVYGDLENILYEETPTRYRPVNFPTGFSENLPLHFQSPYGCSKGAADQYMLDYARMFGLKTVVFRHSSIYGGRQYSTFDQGWMGWFIQQALETQKNKNHTFTIAGNGKQVRDVLFVSDLVACYLTAIRYIDLTQEQVFNIGGGIDNSLSLLELFSFLEKQLGIKLNFQQLPWRKSDQKVFVADISKAMQTFTWKPVVNYKKGIEHAIQWMQSIC